MIKQLRWAPNEWKTGFRALKDEGIVRDVVPKMRILNRVWKERRSWRDGKSRERASSNVPSRACSGHCSLF